MSTEKENKIEQAIDTILNRIASMGEEFEPEDRIEILKSIALELELMIEQAEDEK